MLSLRVSVSVGCFFLLYFGREIYCASDLQLQCNAHCTYNAKVQERNGRKTIKNYLHSYLQQSKVCKWLQRGSHLFIAILENLNASEQISGNLINSIFI